MSFIAHNKQYNIQCPLTHTEGKLKAYESCLDARAWSHNCRERDRYLREWIKCDMPSCLVPITTLIGFFSAMTCMSKGKVTPRCHPDCKSKVILESINTSCEAIRECLKADRNLNKFIYEEELESSHWPCEKYLEALKCIKLFWKVLLEKVFAINLQKNKCFQHETCNCESVRDLARHWEQEMVQQTKFVKKMTPQLLDNALLDKLNKKPCLKKSDCKRGSPRGHEGSCCASDNTDNIHCKSSSPKCPHKRVTLNCLHTEVDDIPNRCCKSLHNRKDYKSVSKKVNTSNVCCGCDTTDYDRELETYKSKISSLQRSNCLQKEEIERLKQENYSLKCELQKVKKLEWTSPIICATALLPNKDVAAIIPEPFESYLEENCSSKSSTKETESEVLITMKKCQHESYKHVSLLQVLHKTNDPSILENYSNEPCYKNEDPIQLLTKVHATLGAMVKREMTLAKSEMLNGDKSDIEASFQSINGFKTIESESSYK